MAGLFTSLKVKKHVLSNRIVLPPMGTGLATESGEVTDAHIEHYVDRAKADLGMVIVESTYIRRDGPLGEKQLGIYDDNLIPGLRRLTEAVRACGAVVGIQINHGGGKAARELVSQQPISASDGIVPGATEPARAATIEEIEDIVTGFVSSARRAREACFDFVEIHGAHGYLLSQFLSPLTNRRTDQYGGDLKSRLRLPLEIVHAIRREIGDEDLLLYRLGACDYMTGGLTEEEGKEAAILLAQAGIDIMDISGGLCGMEDPDWDEVSQGYFVPMAEGIQNEVNVPVIVAGGITDPGYADELIRKGQVELVAIGRALLSDPNWAVDARKALHSATE